MIEEIQIYTDCAGADGAGNLFGVSVFVIDHHENETIFSYGSDIKSLNKEFKSKNKRGNISIGECYAVYKALHFIKAQNHIKTTEINYKIYIDNLHVFLLLNNQCRCKRKQVMRKNNLLFRLLNKCNLIKSDNIEILWINGHKGIYGNEIANTAAEKIYKINLSLSSSSDLQVPVTTCQL